MFYCELLPFFVLLKGNDFMLSDLISDLLLYSHGFRLGCILL